MAHVNDVQVNYGWTPDGRPFADLTFVVHFDPNDVQMNQHFGLYIGFFSQHNQGFRPMQMGWNRPFMQGGFRPGFQNGWNGGYNGWNNGFGYNQFQGQFGQQFQGQQLVWSTRETIYPNGMRSQVLNRRVMLNNQFQQFNMQQLCAQVWLMPDYQEQTMGMPMMNGNGRVGFDRSLPQAYNQAYQNTLPAYNNGYNSGYGYPQQQYGWNNYGYQGGYGNPYQQYGYGFPQAPYNWNGWNNSNWNNWNNWSYAGPYGYDNGSYNNGFGYGYQGSYNNYQGGYNSYSNGSYPYGNSGYGYGDSYGMNNWDSFGPGFRSYRTQGQPADAYATAV